MQTFKFDKYHTEDNLLILDNVNCFGVQFGSMQRHIIPKHTITSVTDGKSFNIGYLGIGILLCVIGYTGNNYMTSLEGTIGIILVGYSIWLYLTASLVITSWSGTYKSMCCSDSHVALVVWLKDTNNTPIMNGGNPMTPIQIN